MPKLGKHPGRRAVRTLMGDLENGPQNLMPLLAFMRPVLSILHLIAEFEKRVFKIIKSIGRWLATACRPYWWHIGCVVSKNFVGCSKTSIRTKRFLRVV